MQTRVRLGRFAARVVFDDYLDLYLLAATALVISILGLTAVVDVKILVSATLALLAVLAFSQIRSRRNVSEITKAQRPDPLAVFRTEFPEDIESRRSSASSLLLIGLSMSRTVRGVSQASLRTILISGGSIRVLLLDPENHELVRAASRYRVHGITPDALKKRIQGSLDELKELSDSTSGNLEIRVTSYIPQMSINAIDIGRRNGFIVIQHYEYMPVAEPSPIFCLTRSDPIWFDHFVAEAERIWDAGVRWPSATS